MADASTDEFEAAARTTADRLRGAPLLDRIAVACRGSANPAALAWIAEGLALDDESVVIDLGAGLGGPAAWLALRYRCRVVAVEPAPSAAAGAEPLFDVPAVRGDASRAPLRDGCAHAVLLLGVASVVPEPVKVLCEARRLGHGLGLLDYCARGRTPVEAGGSTFPPVRELVDWMRMARWDVLASTEVDLPGPPPWQRAIDEIDAAPTSDDEDEVRRVIEANDVVPTMMIATAMGPEASGAT